MSSSQSPATSSSSNASASAAATISNTNNNSNNGSLSFEAIPCVLKNAQGTPVYGLLVRPLQQSSVVLQPPSVGVAGQMFANAASVCHPGLSAPFASPSTIFAASAANHGAMNNYPAILPFAAQTAPPPPAVSGNKVLLPPVSATVAKSGQNRCVPTSASSSRSLLPAATNNNNCAAATAKQFFIPASAVQNMSNSKSQRPSSAAFAASASVPMQLTPPNHSVLFSNAGIVVNAGLSQEPQQHQALSYEQQQRCQTAVYGGQHAEAAYAAYGQNVAGNATADPQASYYSVVSAAAPPINCSATSNGQIPHMEQFLQEIDPVDLASLLTPEMSASLLDSSDPMLSLESSMMASGVSNFMESYEQSFGHHSGRTHPQHGSTASSSHSSGLCNADDGQAYNASNGSLASQYGSSLCASTSTFSPCASSSASTVANPKYQTLLNSNTNLRVGCHTSNPQIVSSTFAAQQPVVLANNNDNNCTDGNNINNNQLIDQCNYTSGSFYPSTSKPNGFKSVMGSQCVQQYLPNNNNNHLEQSYAACVNRDNAANHNHGAAAALVAANESASNGSPDSGIQSIAGSPAAPQSSPFPLMTSPSPSLSQTSPRVYNSNSNSALIFSAPYCPNQDLALGKSAYGRHYLPGFAPLSVQTSYDAISDAEQSASIAVNEFHDCSDEPSTSAQITRSCELESNSVTRRQRRFRGDAAAANANNKVHQHKAQKQPADAKPKRRSNANQFSDMPTLIAEVKPTSKSTKSNQKRSPASSSAALRQRIQASSTGMKTQRDGAAAVIDDKFVQTKLRAFNEKFDAIKINLSSSSLNSHDGEMVFEERKRETGSGGSGKLSAGDDDPMATTSEYMRSVSISANATTPEKALPEAAPALLTLNLTDPTAVVDTILSSLKPEQIACLSKLFEEKLKSVAASTANAASESLPLAATSISASSCSFGSAADATTTTTDSEESLKCPDSSALPSDAFDYRSPASSFAKSPSFCLSPAPKPSSQQQHSAGSSGVKPELPPLSVASSSDWISGYNSDASSVSSRSSCRRKYSLTSRQQEKSSASTQHRYVKTESVSSVVTRSVQQGRTKDRKMSADFVYQPISSNRMKAKTVANQTAKTKEVSSSAAGRSANEQKRQQDSATERIRQQNMLLKMQQYRNKLNVVNPVFVAELDKLNHMLKDNLVVDPVTDFRFSSATTKTFGFSVESFLVSLQQKRLAEARRKADDEQKAAAALASRLRDEEERRKREEEENAAEEAARQLNSTSGLGKFKKLHTSRTCQENGQAMGCSSSSGALLLTKTLSNLEEEASESDCDSEELCASTCLNVESQEDAMITTSGKLAMPELQLETAAEKNATGSNDSSIVVIQENASRSNSLKIRLSIRRPIAAESREFSGNTSDDHPNQSPSTSAATENVTELISSLCIDRAALTSTVREFCSDARQEEKGKASKTKHRKRKQVEKTDARSEVACGIAEANSCCVKRLRAMNLEDAAKASSSKALNDFAMDLLKPLTIELPMLSAGDLQNACHYSPVSSASAASSAANRADLMTPASLKSSSTLSPYLAAPTHADNKRLSKFKTASSGRRKRSVYPWDRVKQKKPVSPGLLRRCRRCRTWIRMSKNAGDDPVRAVSNGSQAHEQSTSHGPSGQSKASAEPILCAVCQALPIASRMALLKRKRSNGKLVAKQNAKRAKLVCQQSDCISSPHCSTTVNSSSSRKSLKCKFILRSNSSSSLRKSPTSPSVQVYTLRQSIQSPTPYSPSSSAHSESSSSSFSSPPMLQNAMLSMKQFAQKGLYANANTSAKELGNIWNVKHCSLLEAKQRGQISDFLLPFDIWMEFGQQKAAWMSKDFSKDYRQIKNNIYIETKTANSSQSQTSPTICCCKLPPSTAAESPNANEAEHAAGCKDDCLNRMMYAECVPQQCPLGELCSNQRFQKHEWAKGLEMFHTNSDRGFGVRSKHSIQEGDFVCEYVGEVVSADTFWWRMKHLYSHSPHHYALNLDSGTVIDAYRTGSIARFVNHSCRPNCEMQKWLVNGQHRMGIFALRRIDSFEELTYDYNFHSFDKQQKCLCSADSCRGALGGRSKTGDKRKRFAKSADASAAIVRQPTDLLSWKLQLIRPLSHRERSLVVRSSLFLLRCVDRIRRKLRLSTSASLALNLSPEKQASIDVDKKKADLILAQLTALKSNRSILTRRLANAEENPDVVRLVRLSQILKTITNKLRIAKATFTSDVLSVNFDTIDSNIAVGQYADPEAFDADICQLFAKAKSCQSDHYDAICQLEQVYQDCKRDCADQLRDVLEYQLSDDFLTATEDRSLTSPTMAQPSPLVVITTVSSEETQQFPPRSSSTLPDTGFIDTTYDPDNDASFWLPRADLYADGNQEDKVRCTCGMSEDDGLMIQCDDCQYWQHATCIGERAKTDGAYSCDRCLDPVSYRVAKGSIVLDPQPEIRLPGCTYYRTLMNGTVQIRLGECVYVRRVLNESHKDALRALNRDCVQQQTTSNCSRNVGEMLSCISSYDNSSCNGSESADVALETQLSSSQGTADYTDAIVSCNLLRIFRIERLFSGPNGETFVFGSYFARPHETFCEPTRRFYRNELFCTPLYDTLPLETIVARCLVLDPTTFCKGRPKLPRYREEDVYICEFRVDRGQRLFGKLKYKYPVIKKAYIFESFKQPLKIKRDFTPFGVFSTKQSSKSTNSKQQQKANKISTGHAHHSSAALPRTNEHRPGLQVEAASKQQQSDPNVAALPAYPVATIRKLRTVSSLAVGLLKRRPPQLLTVLDGIL